MNDDKMIERLDIIINLLAAQVAPADSLTDRVRILRSAGMSNTQIAKVVGTTADSVSTLSRRPTKKKSSAKR